MGFPNPSGETVLAINYLLLAIAAFIIGLRLHLRLRVQHRRLDASDIFICLAWITSLAGSSMDVVAYCYGALSAHVTNTMDGYHGTDEQTLVLLKGSYAATIPFYGSIYLAKGALLALYRRFFHPYMIKRRIILWLVIVYVGVAFVVSIAVNLFLCWPADRAWSLDPDYGCETWMNVVMFRTSWSLHISGDIMIFILPWLVIYQLKLKTAVRISIYCVFLLGLITMAFSLSRFIIIETSGGDADVSITLVELWSIIDNNVSLIIACLPTLRSYLIGGSDSDERPNIDVRVVSRNPNRRVRSQWNMTQFLDNSNSKPSAAGESEDNISV